jgi:hypothetical protein
LPIRFQATALAGILRKAADDLDSANRMLLDACLDLGAIHEVLGLDHEEAGGAAPILEAIGELKVLAGKLIPGGWKLVPIEPTEDMVVEGFESRPDPIFSEPEVWEAFDRMSGCQQAEHKARLCYAAMLDAAPRVAESERTGDRFEFEHAGTTHTLYGERAAINALVQWRKHLEKVTNNALAMAGTRRKNN